jgi:hypothetical protein
MTDDGRKIKYVLCVIHSDRTEKCGVFKSLESSLEIFL